MTNAASPDAVYAQRLEERRAAEAVLTRRSDRIGTARLVTFLGGLVLAWGLTFGGWGSTWWLAAPVAVFVGFVVAHDRALLERDRVRRAVAWYERGRARVADRWAGLGPRGERFADPAHLYAQDLDLFGDASLFQLLCTAQTRAGQATLAAWLTTPAGGDEVEQRQAAVGDLRPRVLLRERLATVGAELRKTVHPEALEAWAVAPAILRGWAPRAVAVAITLMVPTTVVAWNAGAPLALPVLALVAMGGVIRRYATPTSQVLHAAGGPAHELVVLGEVARVVREARYSAGRLKTLSDELDTASGEVHDAARRLQRLVEMHDWQHNLVFAPIAAVLLWQLHLAYLVEAWRARHGAAVAGWLRRIGEMEALAALATYAYEHPDDPFPELVTDAPAPSYAATALAHPLIPGAGAVVNDVRLAARGETPRGTESGDPPGPQGATREQTGLFVTEEQRRGAGWSAARMQRGFHHGLLAQDRAPQVLLVSGSNMSGKTTLLRSVGVSVVMALMGAPVRAGALRLSPMTIGATLRIEDSLQAGRSRFYTEVLRLGQIVTAARAGPTLFLFDELFHGTNSHDRSEGARGLLRSLLELGAIGLVTTHDLALAEIAARLTPAAANVHFDDSLEDGDMRFDYRLKPGPVTRSNALAIMRAVGLTPDRGRGGGGDDGGTESS